MENKIFAKCLKSYLTAKKYYDTDADKSFDYFKQCIAIMNDIKEQNMEIPRNLIDIMDETETECSKYLTMTIENTIDTPIIGSKHKNICFTGNTTNDNNLLYEIIETGNIKKMKEFKLGEVDFNIMNNMGLTPLHYAITYGDTAFLKQAFRLGAPLDMTNKNGYTLLECACLEKDPNMINFMLSYGADMKKHLQFRENKKYSTTGNMIEIMLLEKIILDYETSTNHTIQYLDWIFNYLDKDEMLDLQIYNSEPSNKLKNYDLIKKLDMMLTGMNDEFRTTYIDILKEEMGYDLHYKLGCPNRKLEIILYNLVPFINYNINLQINWLVSMEIKFLILKILKNKVKINTKQLKEELRELLYLNYIKPNLFTDGYIQTLVLQWINKIKV